MPHLTNCNKCEKPKQCYSVSFRTSQLWMCEACINRYLDPTPSATTCLSGSLFLTTGNRIVLDNHNCETFFKGCDKELMTAEDLTQGIQFSEFMKRLAEAMLK